MENLRDIDKSRKDIKFIAQKCQTGRRLKSSL